MSNKFNEFGGDGSDSVTNGSLDIYGYSLKAENLDANQPLKTNSDKQLVSSQLNISDVVNLQAELDSSIQNPNQSILISDGVEIANANNLNFSSGGDISNATTITATGQIFGARIVSTDIIVIIASNEFSRIKTNSIEQLNFGTDILQQGQIFKITASTM